MSKSKQDKPRHSLQPQSNHQVLPGPLRHTKSHNYDKKGARKKISTTIPTIHEVEGEATSAEVYHQVLNEKQSKKERKTSIRSEGGRKSGGYDNAGFEGSTGSLAVVGSGRQNFQRNFTQQSFTSTSSIKDPSVRSLP